MSQTIAMAVAEQTRAAIQAMAATVAERPTKCGRTQDRRIYHEAAHIQLVDGRQIYQT